MNLLILFLLYTFGLSLALGRAGLRTTWPGGSMPESGQDDGIDSGQPASTPSRLLVIGATGGTGRQLVEQALARGYTVTALVRNPSALQTRHERLSVVQGDVLDAASLRPALKGQEAVLCALGHKKFFYPNRILSQGTQNILQAMEAEGVTRLICETSLGIGDSVGRMGLYYTFFVIPVILPFYYWDKTRQERIIAQSRSDWTIVRPAVLTNGQSRGCREQGRSVGNFLWTARIPRADVAGFILDQLGSQHYLKNTVGIA